MKRGLHVYNEQNKLAQWAQTVAQCRASGLSARQWWQEHRVNVLSYYKWQRKLYAMAQTQQKIQFAEVTLVQPLYANNIAVTVRIAGAEADIRSSADAATVETVLRVLKSC